MTAQLQSPWLTFYDSDGMPLVGAKIRVYEPGTSTPLDVYSDEDATTPVSQPIVTNAAGRITRYYVDQKYRMTVHTSADVLVDDVDDQDPGLPSGFGVSATVGIAQGGTGATNAAAARSNLGAASASSLTAIQDTVTDHTTKINTGLNVSDTTRFGTIAKVDSIAASNLTGMTVCTQRVVKTTLSNSTTTSSIPYDTSIPQVGEGTLLFTQSFTPLTTTSEIRIHVHLEYEASAQVAVVLALFKNSDADAVMACGGSVGNTSLSNELNLHYRVSPGSTSAVTWNARMGIAGGNTLRVNGSGGTGTLGGLSRSFIAIEEWETLA